MNLKQFGVGIILPVLILSACQSQTEPTPTAQPVSQIVVNNPAGDAPSSFTITTDMIDIAPGDSVEIKTPTPQFESAPVYGSVYLKNAEMTIPQGELLPEVRFQGSLPTPCHQLILKVDPINNQNQIVIKVLASANLKQVCSNALQPFDQKIKLTNVPSGTYSVWVSGTKLGEFSVP